MSTTTQRPPLGRKVAFIDLAFHLRPDIWAEFMHEGAPAAWVPTDKDRAELVEGKP